MKYLPLAMTKGPLLAEAIRSAVRGAGRSGLCGWCGTAIPALGRSHAAQCPACARFQHTMDVEETPWRLTPSSAEALRRTRTWLRRLGFSAETAADAVSRKLQFRCGLATRGGSRALRRPARPVGPVDAGRPDR